MIVAPSVLSLDYSQFSESLDILNQTCEWLHFDVMDGHFVPNLSFGPDILNTFRRNSSLFIDTHLMITNPDFFIKRFVDAGSDLITFHYEVKNDIEECKKTIDTIHSYYIKAGLSIKLDTPVEAIIPLLKDLDMVLVMSIEPGFGGQSFTEAAHEKIAQLAKYRKDHNLSYLIEVDGGVNDTNARQLVAEGCDVLVAGSFIFKGDIVKNIAALKGEKLEQ